MEIQDTLVYVSMIITVGISMIILTTVESFKNIFLTPQINNVIYYLLSVFLVTVFQWALGEQYSSCITRFSKRWDTVK